MYENSVGPDKTGSAVRLEMGLEEALLGRERAEHQIEERGAQGKCHIFLLDRYS